MSLTNITCIETTTQKKHTCVCHTQHTYHRHIFHTPSPVITNCEHSWCKTPGCIELCRSDFVPHFMLKSRRGHNTTQNRIRARQNLNSTCCSNNSSSSNNKKLNSNKQQQQQQQQQLRDLHYASEKQPNLSFSTQQKNTGTQFRTRDSTTQTTQTQ